MSADKPLKVRVAEALDCKVEWVPAGGFLREVNPEAGYWTCSCDRLEGHVFGRPHESHNGGVLPYGEDSPEGWACGEFTDARIRANR